jgi:nucleotide-binding universal stress UspA family protein
MYETVLVAVDGSDASSAAVGHAVTIGDTDTTVHVLSVVEPSGSSLAFGVDDVAEIGEAISDLAETILAGVDSPAVSIETEVRRGAPVYEVILEYADEIDAELLVLGTGGTSILPEAVFGSTADRVSRLADRPIVLVPATGTG